MLMVLKQMQNKRKQNFPSPLNTKEWPRSPGGPWQQRRIVQESTKRPNTNIHYMHKAEMLQRFPLTPMNWFEGLSTIHVIKDF